MPCKTATRLNLFQCKMLVANGFLSTDSQTEYQHESVIDRLWELQARKDEVAIKATIRHQARISDELPPPLPPECDEGIPENQWLFI